MLEFNSKTRLLDGDGLEDIVVSYIVNQNSKLQILKYEQGDLKCSLITEVLYTVILLKDKDAHILLCSDSAEIYCDKALDILMISNSKTWYIDLKTGEEKELTDIELMLCNFESLEI